MNLSVYIGIFLFGICISSFSQILLKKSAGEKKDNFIKEYLNIRVIIAYLIFIAATFCSIFAYKSIPLSMGPILESMQYVFIAILSHLFLKEHISKRKVLGLFVIVMGVIVFSS